MLPPTHFALALLAMLVLHFLAPLARIVSSPHTEVGAVLVIVGATLNALADRAFKSVGTTVKPFERSTTSSPRGCLS